MFLEGPKLCYNNAESICLQFWESFFFFVLFCFYRSTEVRTSHFNHLHRNSVTERRLAGYNWKEGSRVNCLQNFIRIALEWHRVGVRELRSAWEAVNWFIMTVTVSTLVDYQGQGLRDIWQYHFAFWLSVWSRNKLTIWLFFLILHFHGYSV